MFLCQRLGRLPILLAAAFGTAWCVLAVIFLWVIPHFDSYRGFAELADRTNAAVPPGTMLHLVELRESQITYYLRLPMKRHDKAEQFVSEASPVKDAVYVLTERRVIERIRTKAAIQELDANVPLRRTQPPDQRLVLLRVGNGRR
jgi:hypothetical protein